MFIYSHNSFFLNSLIGNIGTYKSISTHMNIQHTYNMPRCVALLLYCTLILGYELIVDDLTVTEM